MRARPSVRSSGYGFEAAVADGVLSRVDPFGWDDFGNSVGGDAAVPFAVVQQMVVVEAKESTIVEVGGSATGPALGVVNFAPRWLVVVLTTRQGKG